MRPGDAVDSPLALVAHVVFGVGRSITASDIAEPVRLCGRLTNGIEITVIYTTGPATNDN